MGGTCTLVIVLFLDRAARRPIAGLVYSHATQASVLVSRDCASIFLAKLHVQLSAQQLT